MNSRSKWLRRTRYRSLPSIATDERGNTMVITAVAIIPLLFLVGSAIDLSRGYLTKNRLQQACDAGVLAGRKVMTSGIDDAVRSETRKFVNFNFPQGMTGTTPFPVDPAEGQNSAVDLRLATRLPTVLMNFFGVDDIPLSVECTARQDFVNTDVMLVLDTTGSMNCLPSESGGCSTEKSGSKIQALRAGVVDLYKSLERPQENLEKAGLRLRYGVVPYSMTVNTGKLVYELNSSYIRNPAEYTQCNSGNGAGCSARKVSKTHSAKWLKDDWKGCIEERQTVTTIDASSGYDIPSGAKDLDIDSAPTGDSTKWAPYDPDSVSAKNSFACPSRARLLAPFDSESDVSDYAASLKGEGNTYHDIGLIWGGRLMSPDGMWKSSNPNSFKGFPVNRHLIFMTDGIMDPDPNAYTAYGVERQGAGGRRVTGNGNGTKQEASHTQRFRMMCNRIKEMGVTVWVIAFGTGLTTDLRNCASSSGNAFKADDQAQLRARFAQIGESIGDLRLSK